MRQLSLYTGGDRTRGSRFQLRGRRDVEDLVGGGDPPPPRGRGGGGDGPRRTGTFRLASSPGINAQAIVQLARDLWRSDPVQSARLLIEGWEIHPEPAEALAGSRVPFQVERGKDGPVVVFTWLGDQAAMPVLYSWLRDVASPIRQGFIFDAEPMISWEHKALLDEARQVMEAIAGAVQLRPTHTEAMVHRRGIVLLARVDSLLAHYGAGIVMADPDGDDYIRFFGAELAAQQALRPGKWGKGR